MRNFSRHTVAMLLLAMTGTGGVSPAARAAEAKRFDITAYGAVADGKRLNTPAIQATIDACATAGGGTVVVPKGEFLCGSVFLKPGVNLELLEGSVLKGSPKLEDYAVQQGVRFEGHFSEARVGLINAERADHLRISGPGMLDGNGEVYWDAKTPKGRPRLCYIRDSADVTVSGVRFMNSASWNLHFYNCQNVLVENSRFEISDTGKGPSTDGTDIDSCENVTVRGCFYSVNDDCVCIKGNRYDGLDQTPLSPPSKNVRVTDCTFRRGMGALSLGTEATVIRDIEMSNCTVTGNMPMLRIKMRPDTPGQDYQDVRVHDIKLDGPGVVLLFSLTHGTKVAPRPPRSTIKNVSVWNITGKFGAFGKIAANANTDISEISLKNIDVTVGKPNLIADGVTGLVLDNVVVNGAAVATTAPSDNNK